MGTFFSVAGTASINDVFFIHQRGSRAGFWNFAVIVSVNAAPVIMSMSSPASPGSGASVC